MKAKPLSVSMNRSEREQLKLAAKLRGVTPREWVVRAINAALLKQGVDAVLLRERE